MQRQTVPWSRDLRKTRTNTNTPNSTSTFHTIDNDETTNTLATIKKNSTTATTITSRLRAPLKKNAPSSKNASKNISENVSETTTTSNRTFPDFYNPNNSIYKKNALPIDNVLQNIIINLQKMTVVEKIQFVYQKHQTTIDTKKTNSLKKYQSYRSGNHYRNYNKSWIHPNYSKFPYSKRR